MSQPQQSSEPPARFHAVRFYENPGALGRIVCEFLGEGIAQGTPALVIATPEHRTTIEAELGRRGFDVPNLTTTGALTIADADHLLRLFMRDDMPDAALFRSALIPLLEQITHGRKCSSVRAYGEMVDVLWRAGHTVAAVKLEMLWNELARSHDFALLCGYAMGNFYKDASVDEICQHHTHLVSRKGELGLVDGKRQAL